MLREKERTELLGLCETIKSYANMHKDVIAYKASVDTYVMHRVEREIADGCKEVLENLETYLSEIFDREYGFEYFEADEIEITIIGIENVAEIRAFLSEEFLWELVALMPQSFSSYGDELWVRVA